MNSLSEFANASKSIVAIAGTACWVTTQEHLVTAAWFQQWQTIGDQLHAVVILPKGIPVIVHSSAISFNADRPDANSIAPPAGSH